MVTNLALFLCLFVVHNAKALECSHGSKGCDMCSNASYRTEHQQLIFDSISIVNDSFEIEFDIKVSKHCYSCTIMQIPDLISLSINSKYNIFQISVRVYDDDTDIDAFVVQNSFFPNADILLPANNQSHHIYLSNKLLSSNSMYNQNIFKIYGGTKKFERYYYGGAVLAETNNTDSYDVYIGYSALQSTDILNASITNICMNTPINTVSAGNVSEGELRCGDIKYGTLSWSEKVDYYYFELTHADTSDVIFDTCGSSNEIYIDMHTMGGDRISAIWEDNCSPGAQLLVPSLAKGRYIVQMGANADINNKVDNFVWRLRVSCSTNKDVDNTQVGSTYYTFPELILQNTEWFEAERKCEALYSSTLATIVTDQDLAEALDVIEANLEMDAPYNGTVCVWIGLAQTDVDKSSWKWVDGTSCEYTPSGDCIDDRHWYPSQPDGKPVSEASMIHRFAAALCITQPTNNSNLPMFYDLQFDAEPSGDLFFLCNGPDSKYNVKNCSWENQNCWGYDSWEHQFSDYRMESDLTGLNPFIAHYNSTLFIIGNDEIHYTAMKPFDENYFWHHTPYNNGTYWTNAQLYAQYKSALYIYEIRFDDESMQNRAGLLRVDLNTLQFTQESVDFVESVPLITKCIVAGQSVVYFIQQALVFAYYTDIKELWTDSHYGGENLPTFTQQTTTTKCILTDDQRFIYVFYMAYVPMTSHHSFPHLMFATFKYRIGHTAGGKIVESQISDLCLVRNGAVRAISARDGDIYLHGCNAAAWKTMIYDTTKDAFRNTTVDIHVVSKEDMSSYRSAGLVAIDDNILFLCARTQNGFDSYVTITDLVSIDFKETEMIPKVWPSDGFDVKYYMNDFDFYIDSDIKYFEILFYSNDTVAIANITHLVTVNTSKDHCVCTESIYKCFGCHQHFDLENYLTLQDNEVDALIFNITYYGPYNVSKPLITPNLLTIYLQRCVISITKPREIKSNINVGHSIVSEFNLSSNCHTRIGTNFSLNISDVSVSKELVIGIVAHNITTCKVCDYNYQILSGISDEENSKCLQCDGNQFIIVPELEHIQDTDYNFHFIPNLIDLQIISSANNSVPHWRDPEITRKWKWNYLWYILGFLSICIVAMAYIVRRQYNNAFIVDKALILLIPIYTFDGNKAMSLPGVKQEMINLQKLWRDKYNYDVFTCNEGRGRCTKRDVIDFVDEHKIKVEENYKVVIVHIMSHGGPRIIRSIGGDDRTFITSDVSKPGVYRNVAIGFLKHELKDTAEIKFIFNHVCQGENNYSDGDCILPDAESLEQFKNEYKHQQRKILQLVNPCKCKKNGNVGDLSGDSNVEVISGNVAGRTVSDSGWFTECICKSFGDNLENRIKTDYDTLIHEISTNLERITKSELPEKKTTLRQKNIRFEKNIKKADESHIAKEYKILKHSRSKPQPLCELLLIKK